MDHQPETLSARQAAAIAGISDRTVRRWIAAGRLLAERDGDDWLITPLALQAALSAAPDAAQTAAQLAAAAADLAALAARDAALAELVAKQEQTIIELAGRVGWLQSQLQARDERILALEAPKVEPEPEARRAPWWRRIIWGE